MIRGMEISYDIFKASASCYQIFRWENLCQKICGRIAEEEVLP